MSRSPYFSISFFILCLEIEFILIKSNKNIEGVSIPYRGKFWLGDENFLRRKIFRGKAFMRRIFLCDEFYTRRILSNKKFFGGK